MLTLTLTLDLDLAQTLTRTLTLTWPRSIGRQAEAKERIKRILKDLTMCVGGLRMFSHEDYQVMSERQSISDGRNHHTSLHFTPLHSIFH